MLDSRISPRPHLTSIPCIDPAATLVFVINAGAGDTDIDAKRAVIEAALAARGRKGELLTCESAELARVAADAAATALARSTAVIAVGGDGSLNTVAQAAHAAGCAVGVIPYGTFNYFARTHAIPTAPAAAVQCMLNAQPQPVPRIEPAGPRPEPPGGVHAQQRTVPPGRAARAFAGFSEERTRTQGQGSVGS